MRRSESETIGDFRYTFTQLGAREGQRALVRFLKIVAPMLGELKGVTLDSDLSKLGNVFGALASSLSEDDLTYFTDLFAKGTSVAMPSGKNPQLDTIFDLHFADSYDDLLKWLVFCFRVQFASFFRGLASASSATPPAESK